VLGQEVVLVDEPGALQVTSSHTELLAELAALSQVKVFHADTFKRARAAMKAAGLELQRIHSDIRALQARCCGSDDLCNGCRALLALLSDEKETP
jgi:hypothetical protein